MDDFQNAMENLCNGVKNLITMYCATFHVTFSPSGAPARCRGIIILYMLFLYTSMLKESFSLKCLYPFSWINQFNCITKFSNILVTLLSE